MIVGLYGYGGVANEISCREDLQSIVYQPLDHELVKESEYKDIGATIKVINYMDISGVLSGSIAGGYIHGEINTTYDKYYELLVYQDDGTLKTEYYPVEIVAFKEVDSREEGVYIIKGTYEFESIVFGDDEEVSDAIKKYIPTADVEIPNTKKINEFIIEIPK